MEQIRGHGLRDDEIGVMQTADTIVEVIINGWWILSVEDCMTNDHGEGYYLELYVNHKQQSLVDTGFLTIDDNIDGMFVSSWLDVVRFLGWNSDYFRDKSPSYRDKIEAPEPECGWCGATHYPHICDSSMTNLTRLAEKHGE